MIHKYFISVTLIIFCGLSCFKRDIEVENNAKKSMYISVGVGLRLRKQPSLDAVSLKTIPLGERILVQATQSNQIEFIESVPGLWLAAEHQGISGFIFSAYVTEFDIPALMALVIPKSMRQTCTDKFNSIEKERKLHNSMEPLFTIEQCAKWKKPTIKMLYRNLAIVNMLTSEVMAGDLGLRDRLYLFQKNKWHEVIDDQGFGNATYEYLDINLDGKLDLISHGSATACCERKGFAAYLNQDLNKFLQNKSTNEIRIFASQRIQSEELDYSRLSIANCDRTRAIFTKHTATGDSSQQMKSFTLKCTTSRFE